MFGLRTPIPFLATAILLVAPVEATTSYYAGGAAAEAAFDAALGDLTLMNPVLTFSAGDLAAGGLINANDTGIDFWGFSSANNPTDFTVNSGKLTATQAAQKVTIEFPAEGIYAFGIHITIATSSFGNWCFELAANACNANVVTTTSSGTLFLGFVSDTPITGPLFLRPVSSNPVMVLPDFQAYSVSTPEPHTMLLTGLGLLILPLARRKFRKRV